MRAIIMATGDAPGTVPLNEHYPTPLLPLADRPFLQHVIEFCVHQGVTRFDLVLSHLPEKIEEFVGDGKRWGASVTTHLARDPTRPYRMLKILDLATPPGEPLLLAHADRLPQACLADGAAAGSVPTLFYWDDEAATEPDRRRWTGWALLAPEGLVALPADPTEAELEAHFRATIADERSWCRVPAPLSVATFDAILASHHAALNKTFTGLFLGGREADPGIWLSRNVKLHPTVQFTPPVYVGENCSVGKGVRLGPNAVIGHDCWLDDHCQVANSVVFSGSYIGQALELEDALVDKNRLINARLGGAVPITDNFLIGSMAGGHFWRGTASLFGWMFAIVLFLLSLPVLLLLALGLRLFRRGPVLHPTEAVRLPAPAEAYRWRTYRLLSFGPRPAAGPTPDVGIPCGFRNFFLRFLPGVLNVIRGHLAFVGLPPRTREEIQLLPHDWRTLYLNAKAGLVTEAAVRGAAPADEDAVYAAEAFYVATANLKYDLKLLLRYLARSLLGFRRPRTEDE